MVYYIFEVKTTILYPHGNIIIIFNIVPAHKPTSLLESGEGTDER